MCQFDSKFPDFTPKRMNKEKNLQKRNYRVNTQLNQIKKFIVSYNNDFYNQAQQYQWKCEKAQIMKYFDINNKFTASETQELMNKLGIGQHKMRILASEMKKKFKYSVFASEAKVNEIIIEQSDKSAKVYNITLRHKQSSKKTSKLAKYRSTAVVTTNIFESFSKLFTTRINNNKFHLLHQRKQYLDLNLGADGSFKGYGETIGANAWSSSQNKSNSAFTLITEDNVKDDNENLNIIYRCGKYKENLHKLMNNPILLSVHLINKNNNDKTQSYLCESILIAFETNAQHFWNKRKTKYLDENPHLKSRPQNRNTVINNESMFGILDIFL